MRNSFNKKNTKIKSLVNLLSFFSLIASTSIRSIDAAEINIDNTSYIFNTNDAQVRNPIQSIEFSIKKYIVEGNTIIPNQTVDLILKPFLGESQSFANVQTALETLQKHFVSLGYSTVKVTLPEQELRDATIILKVIEQKIGDIKVDGNINYSEKNIKASVPALKNSTLPVTVDITSNLRLANENPGKTTAVTYKTNENNLESLDAIIIVTENKPTRLFITLDNTGNEPTGKTRLSVGYQNYNLFDQDHRFTMQYITTYEKSIINTVSVLGVGYSIPIYSMGDSLDFTAAYSDVDSGNLLNGAITVTSRGSLFGARYNRHLPTIDHYQHKFVLGADYKDFRPATVLQGTGNLTPTVTSTPISLAYIGTWQSAKQSTNFKAEVNMNIPFTSSGKKVDFKRTPWFSEEKFTKLLLSADYYRDIFTNWQVHAGIDGQYSNDHLIPGEQYGLGGLDSVRGWRERTFGGDKGYRYTLEAVSPDYGKAFSEHLGIKTTLFFDKGWVNSNRTNEHPSQPAGYQQSIASVGVGFKFNYTDHFIGRIDTAIVIDGNDPTITSQNQSRSQGEAFVHANFAFTW